MHNSNKFCHPAHDEQHQHAAPAEATKAAATAVSQHKEQQQKYMAGTCKHILVHRTAAYNSVVQLQSIRSRYSVLKAHTRCLSLFFFYDKNKIKRKSAPGFVPSTSFSEGVQSTFQPPVYQDNISQIKVYLGVAPARVGKHEHGKARRANTTRMVDLISS